MQLQTDEDFAGAEFQSTPSTEAGRCDKGSAQNININVSIHAQH